MAPAAMSEQEKKLDGPDFARGVPLEDLAEGSMILGQAAGEVVPWAVCWSRWYSSPRSGIAMAPPPTPKTPPKNPAAPPSAVVASIRNAAESIQVISRRGPRTGPRGNTPSFMLIPQRP